jgi:hypothetical protein
VTAGASALDYFPCRYGASKLTFRGPRQRTDGRFVAVLGGTETFGRFVERPFSTLLGADCGLPVVNLGCVNGGVDAFLGDGAVLDLCAGAAVTVIQLLGAQNLSNRLYRVHPRRNDRFVAAAPALRALYGEVDFAEIHFTRHLMVVLQSQGHERFAAVVAELQAAWLRRMRRLLSAAGGRRVLLWIGEAPPGDAGALEARGPDPLFVTRAMIEALRPEADAVVEVVAAASDRAAGTAGMVFAAAEAEAAATAPTVAQHRAVAAALGRALRPLLA